MGKRINKSSGFTLIELLVTISIMAVLFGVVITAAAAASRNSRDAQRLSDLRNIQQALQHYYVDYNYYPMALTDLSPTYLSSLPTDPTFSSTAPYCYAAANSSGTACDNPSSDFCKKYTLNAEMENSSTGGPYTCSSIATYNYQVTPLQ